MKWTKEEDEIIRKYYTTMDYEDLLKFLPNRNLGQIVNRASKKLKVRRDRVSKPYIDISELSETTLAYIAGLIDGEGCITLGRHKPGVQHPSGSLDPVVHVSNTYKPLIDWLKKITHDKSKIHINNRKREPNAKKGYKFRLYRLADVKLLLEVCLPYLMIKKKQAELLIEFCKRRITLCPTRYDPYTNREFEIYDELRRLNERGQRKRMKIVE